MPSFTDGRMAARGAHRFFHAGFRMDAAVSAQLLVVAAALPLAVALVVA